MKESENEMVVLFQWNLVGTLFLASGKLNKAQKQISKDLIGPKCFSMWSFSDIVIHTLNILKTKCL